MATKWSYHAYKRDYYDNLYSYGVYICVRSLLTHEVHTYVLTLINTLPTNVHGPVWRASILLHIAMTLKAQYKHSLGTNKRYLRYQVADQNKIDVDQTTLYDWLRHCNSCLLRLATAYDNTRTLNTSCTICHHLMFLRIPLLTYLYSETA